jgi:hypothetical protein
VLTSSRITRSVRLQADPTVSRNVGRVLDSQCTAYAIALLDSNRDSMADSQICSSS